jgi:predicted transcriptional regulator of viral defense system
MIPRFEPLKYLESLQAKGRSSFTSIDFSKALSIKGKAAEFALIRLRQKEKIISPAPGFHVLLPPEYQSRGSPPPDFFIDDLMKYLEIPYYVSLLSAAERYGAAHQRPQKFQVMVGEKRRDIICGKAYLQLFFRKNLTEIPFEKKEVRTGWIKVSTPESTAIDLVGYHKQSGGLQNVLTVLSELSESIDSKKLVEAAKFSPISWAQRLGALFSLLKFDELAKDLFDYVETNATFYVPLVPGPVENKKLKDKRWKVYLNETLEADEV